MTVWTISQADSTVDAQGNPDYITTLHWRATDQSGEFTASTYGSVGLTDGRPSSYIPYGSVNEAECIAWVKASLGEEQVSSIEAGMTAQIAEQENPTTAHGTPWA